MLFMLMKWYLLLHHYQALTCFLKCFTSHKVLCAYKSRWHLLEVVHLGCGFYCRDIKLETVGMVTTIYSGSIWLGKAESTTSISSENQFMIFMNLISNNHGIELRKYRFTHSAFTFLGHNFVKSPVGPVPSTSHIMARGLKIANMITSSLLLICVFRWRLLMIDFWPLMSTKSYDFSQVEMMHWCMTLMFWNSLNSLDYEIHEHLKHFEIF